MTSTQTAILASPQRHVTVQGADAYWGRPSEKDAVALLSRPLFATETAELPRIGVCRCTAGDTWEADRMESTYGESGRRVVEAALRVAALGLRVHPLIGKAPVLADWPARATTDGTTIEKWLGGGERNYGVVCDEVAVIDTDTPELSAWWAVNMPATPWAVRTPRGGRHFYYRSSPGLRNAVKAHRGWDVRAGGRGYVVGFDSSVNGKRYELLGQATLDVPPFDPAWLPPDEEAQLLIETTRRSERTYRKLTGEDRVVMYTLAQRTGLRRSELRSLQPSSFDLKSTPPIVRVRAEDSKHRKTDILPLSAAVADLLKPYLEDRSAKKLLWPGSWWRRSAEMLYADLEDAGINPVADDGTVVDFHGQRVTFITELARVGASAAAVQKLARHSDYNLTLRTYTRLRVEDLVNAVEMLPSLGGARGEKDKAAPESQQSPTIPDDARLRELVAVWVSLPEHIKNAIAMLAGPQPDAGKSDKAK